MNVKPGELYCIGYSPWTKDGFWKQGMLTKPSDGDAWKTREVGMPIGAVCMVVSTCVTDSWCKAMAKMDSTKQEYYFGVLVEDAVYYAHFAALWTPDEFKVWGKLPKGTL